MNHIFGRLTKDDLELLVLCVEAIIAGHRAEVQRLEGIEIGSAEWEEQIGVIRSLAQHPLAESERAC